MTTTLANCHLGKDKHNLVAMCIKTISESIGLRIFNGCHMVCYTLCLYDYNAVLNSNTCTGYCRKGLKYFYYYHLILCVGCWMMEYSRGFFASADFCVWSLFDFVRHLLLPLVSDFSLVLGLYDSFI